MSETKKSTDPLSDGRILSLPPADAVTSIRLVGTGIELELPRLARPLTIGSGSPPEVDLPVRVPTVSRLHASVVLRGNRLRVRDEGSTNGVYFRDRRELEFEVSAGQAFRIADVRVIALDESLRRLRPMLEWCLGFGAHAEVDEALAKVAEGDPLCLVGRPGCDQAHLARAIHDTSPRRTGRFVSVTPLESREGERAALVAASRGTAFVDLRVIQRVTSFFVSELFGDAYHVRAVVAAPDHKRIDTLLGPFASRLRAINMRSLAERRADIPRLLNVILRRELNSEREVEALGDKNVEALKTYSWNDNIDGLRRVAPKLLARMETGSTSAAARLLGIRHQSLQETFDTLRLSFGGRRAERC